MAVGALEAREGCVGCGMVLDSIVCMHSVHLLAANVTRSLPIRSPLAVQARRFGGARLRSHVLPAWKLAMAGSESCDEEAEVRHDFGEEDVHPGGSPLPWFSIRVWHIPQLLPFSKIRRQARLLVSSQGLPRRPPAPGSPSHISHRAVDSSARFLVAPLFWLRPPHSGVADVQGSFLPGGLCLRPQF